MGSVSFLGRPGPKVQTKNAHVSFGPRIPYCFTFAMLSLMLST